MEQIYKPKVKGVSSSVWLPEPMYRWVTEHAKQNCVSVSEVFRVAVADFQKRVAAKQPKAK